VTGKTAFETRYGFARDAVLLSNWRESPFNRWSFQNVGELVPSAPIAASGGGEAPAQALGGLLGEKVTLAGEPERSRPFSSAPIPMR
jgi:hypothetical protein